MDDILVALKSIAKANPFRDDIVGSYFLYIIPKRDFERAWV